MRILRGHLGELDGLPHHQADAIGTEIGGIGGACALADQNPQPNSARACFFQCLQLAHADIGGELVSLGDGALGAGRPCGERLFYNVSREVPQAVPPTVILSILMVGIPTPTGTLCPSLPQTPMPSSSSRLLPTMLTCRSASGPLPINVAFRTGRVRWPSSMR